MSGFKNVFKSKKIVEKVKKWSFLYNSDNFYYFLENDIDKK